MKKKGLKAYKKGTKKLIFTSFLTFCTSVRTLHPKKSTCLWERCSKKRKDVFFLNKEEKNYCESRKTQGWNFGTNLNAILLRLLSPSLFIFTSLNVYRLTYSKKKV